MNHNIVRLYGTTILIATGLLLGCNGIGGQSGAGVGNNNNDMVFAGCYAASATAGNVGCGAASTLGDPNSDATFQQEIATQQNFWSGIPATVQPWNDCNGPNSYSLPSGNILYGVNLFQMLVASYGGDAGPVSGVLAHEWGHQVQFDGGWFPANASSSAPIELEADAFSGFYMALGENFSWSSINNYFAAVANSGDYNFNNPSFHGTPQQRLAAAQLGFQTAYQVLSTGSQLTYTDLHQIFSSNIGRFSDRKAPSPLSVGSAAAGILSRLDHDQILEILNGTSRGKDIALPSVANRELLYPRKDR